MDGYPLLHRTQVPVMTLYTMTMTLLLTITFESPTHMALSVQRVVGMANNSIYGIGVPHQAHIRSEYNNHCVILQ